MIRNISLTYWAILAAFSLYWMFYAITEDKPTNAAIWAGLCGFALIMVYSTLDEKEIN